ncbi:MAG: S-layer homology domain-containing protein [Peptococcaceae bacterium]|nr:S-layer homology domain-containing protein [Peptococcaceae bacterium]
MKKKLLSLCVMAALVLSLFPTASLAAENDDAALPFQDVSADDWFYDPVTYAYEQGLMTGTSADTFAPNTAMTRGMIVSVLYRLEGSPALSDGNLGYPYEDVRGDDWYAMPVYWARENGIVSGYSDTQFGPNDPITREQMAAILHNYSAYKGQDVSARADLSKYSDADQVSSWAETVLSWANAEGLINGMTATTIDPQGQATRAQVAAIFQRYLEEETPAPDTKTVTLVIGRPDALKQVSVSLDADAEVTPDVLLEALAKETGWNLSLAAPVSLDADGNAVVALADDGSIYGNPPENQKDDYHVYDVNDWIYTVLNSMDATFKANGIAGVRFTAPDGGDLSVSNGDVQFTLPSDFVWDYDAAYALNHDETSAEA